jgi:hypothetical protein
VTASVSQIDLEGKYCHRDVAHEENGYSFSVLKPTGRLDIQHVSQYDAVARSIISRAYQVRTNIQEQYIVKPIGISSLHAVHISTPGTDDELWP